MVHLTIHLAREASLCGPVQYRWMYPFERYTFLYLHNSPFLQVHPILVLTSFIACMCRYMFKLKTYVRNKSRPEGSMAEGYLAEECLVFCSRYLSGVETQENRAARNEDNEGSQADTSSTFVHLGREIGTSDFQYLDPVELMRAHRYVLFNCDAMKALIE